MSSLAEAISQLNITGWVLRGEPTNESEFNSMFKKVTGVDSEGTAIESSDPSDFGVTWSQVQTKYNELVAAEPLNQVREVRNAKLAETDWVVIKEREEGGSVSNFADWKKYRQELRDITKTYKSLEDVKWPTAPSE